MSDSQVTSKQDHHCYRGACVILEGKVHEFGGLTVRRVLPQVQKRMVGPFVFFDHMESDPPNPDQHIEVGPHPHIGLATVTYLFEGSILHRDSLGSHQLIEPGAINWMTAGKGIVHSERGKGARGIQLWVALPETHEDSHPKFVHHPKEDFPEFKSGGGSARLLLGNAFHRVSPVEVASELFYLEVKLPKGAEFNFDLEVGHDGGVYPVKGSLEVNGASLAARKMWVQSPSEGGLRIRATEDSVFMLLGGKPLGHRYMYWNFVSSTREKIEGAKQAWKSGPFTNNPRFKPIPDDHAEYVPLPEGAFGGNFDPSPH